MQRDRLVGNLRALESGWRSSWVVHEEAACWKVLVMTSPREGFVRFRSILWRRRRSLVWTVPSASKADEPRTLLCRRYSSDSTPATLSHRQTGAYRKASYTGDKNRPRLGPFCWSWQNRPRIRLCRHWPLCTRPNDCYRGKGCVKNSGPETNGHVGGTMFVWKWLASSVVFASLNNQQAWKLTAERASNNSILLTVFGNISRVECTHIMLES